jgi:hypothetical protein
MNRINSKSRIIIGFVLIFQVLTSCISKDASVNNDLTLSFEYVPDGGSDILKTNNMNEEIIKTRKIKDSIEISVYKWIGVPIDDYNGKCELKSDTLYVYYWEELKEVNKNSPQVALILRSQFKYMIKKVKYKNIVVEEKNTEYIK